MIKKRVVMAFYTCPMLAKVISRLIQKFYYSNMLNLYFVLEMFGSSV